MLVCVTATGPELESDIDPRFGRCRYFLFIDPSDLSFEALSNESASLTGGAGVQAAQTVLDKGAQVLLTGSVGTQRHECFPGHRGEDVSWPFRNRPQGG